MHAPAAAALGRHLWLTCLFVLVSTATQHVKNTAARCRARECVASSLRCADPPFHFYATRWCVLARPVPPKPTRVQPARKGCVQKKRSSIAFGWASCVPHLTAADRHQQGGGRLYTTSDDGGVEVTAQACFVHVSAVWAAGHHCSCIGISSPSSDCVVCCSCVVTVVKRPAVLSACCVSWAGLGPCCGWDTVLETQPQAFQVATGCN